MSPLSAGVTGTESDVDVKIYLSVLTIVEDSKATSVPNKVLSFKMSIVELTGVEPACPVSSSLDKEEPIVVDSPIVVWSSNATSN